MTLHILLAFSALASTRTLDLTVDGAASNDRVGSVVALADITSGGSATSDGNADVIVRVQYYDDGSTSDVGAVLVVPGPVSAAFSYADAPTDATLFVGEQASEQVGQAIATGDFNGDGDQDIAIGAQSYVASAPSADGRIYVYFGPLGAGTVQLSATTADALIEGDSDLVNEMGGALAAADLDLDGNDDLAVGCGGYSGSGGSVFLFSGAALTGTLDLVADAEGVLTGDSADALGSEVVRNGDGLLVSDTMCDEGASNGGCVYGVAASTGPFPDGDIGSLTTLDFVLEGVTASGLFGGSVASLHYFPSSSLPDVAVSDGDGFVWIFDAPSGVTFTTDALVGIDVDYASSGLYLQLADAGLVDRDDTEELLIGHKQANLGGPSTEGAAFVVYGALLPGSYSLQLDLCGTDDAVCIAGETSGDDFGVAVAGGDTNQDGRSDILIGADTLGAGDLGRAYLYDGPFDRLGGTVGLADADAVLVGDDAGDQAGYAVAGVGDVNCDGIPDLAVGAVYGDAVSTATGALYVLFGPAPGGGSLAWLNSGVDLSTADFVFYDDATYDWAGNAAAGAGDVDGDGCDDLLIGAAGNDVGATNAGMVYLFYGDPALSGTYGPADADARFRGLVADEFLGTSVSGAGDLDADGYADFLLAAPQADATGTDAGAVFVWYGSGTRFDPTRTYTPLDAPCVLTGERAGDRAGRALAGPLDFDGDGYLDVAVGAPGNDDGGAEAGAAYVVLGDGTRCSGANSLAYADVEIVGALASGQLGTSLAPVRDLDDDGDDELYVGAPYAATDDGRVYWIPGRGAGYATAPAGGTTLCPYPLAVQDHRFGWSVAAPDVDGDGLGDALVGAPWYGSYTGAAHLFYGETVQGWVGDGLCHGADEAEVFLYGEASQDYAGWSVANGGDLNQDGEDDILVGAWGNDAGGATGGAAYVVLASH